MDLKKKLADYEKQFRENDQVYFETDISNQDAYSFLQNEIPLVELPDKEIERTYYYRFWNYRKHIRNTPYGHIITEFLPDVWWAGAYNSINCSTPFHLLEGRWLKDANHYLEEYIDFFLNNIGDAFSYSMSFISALCAYAQIKGRESFLEERYEKIKTWHLTRLEKTIKVGNLYYSNDDRDGMEYSISGPGLRPTINSYIYADTSALAKLAKRINRYEDAEKFQKFAEELRQNMQKLLWDGDFFVTIPECVMKEFETSSVRIPEKYHVRELVGYIPWMYGIPQTSQDSAWQYLFDGDCFYTKYGLTTADQGHRRFMEKQEHECLWNGPIWPFATSQVLKALAEKKRMDSDFFITNEEYVKLLHEYAESQKRVRSDGKRIDWIDENISPADGRWLSRDILKGLGCPASKGGKERGKDYNHSLFGDLVLSGLLGIGSEKGKLTVNSLIPDSWNYFKVENLYFRGKQYTILFDRDGSYYGKEAGTVIREIR